MNYTLELRLTDEEGTVVWKATEENPPQHIASSTASRDTKLRVSISGQDNFTIEVNKGVYNRLFLDEELAVEERRSQIKNESEHLTPEEVADELEALLDE